MSRIGKAVISIPAGVSVDVSKGNFVTVKGSKGTLSEQINPELNIKIEDGYLSVEDRLIRKDIEKHMVFRDHLLIIW
jgi:ribosomal protein L6P/L9E